MDRDEIKSRMKKAGVRQVDIANALGIDPDKVSKSLDARGTRTFSEAELRTIRQMLRQDGDPPSSIDYRTVPIIGQVQAGEWSEAVTRPIGSMPTPDPNLGSKVFGLEVVGDSMDKYIEEGGIVLVDPEDRSLFPKRFYVVKNEDGETTFKQFFSEPARLTPCSSNERYRDIILGDGQTFLIVGRVIWRAARM